MLNLIRENSQKRCHGVLAYITCAIWGLNVLRNCAKHIHPILDLPLYQVKLTFSFQTVLGSFRVTYLKGSSYKPTNPNKQPMLRLDLSVFERSLITAMTPAMQGIMHCCMWPATKKWMMNWLSAARRI